MTPRRIRALVTGATGGLGQAIAERLAGDGLDLVLTGRSAAALNVAVDGLRRAFTGCEIDSEVCDFSADADLRRLVGDLASRDRLPDVLINNAAIQGPIGPFLEAPWSEWTATLAVDLLAPVRLTQLVVPAMRARGWGRVVNISGGGATGPRPDFSAYAVAKTALVRFTETLAHELAGAGVTVNAVAPGPMNTRMLDEVIAAGPGRAPAEYEAAARRAREGGVPPAQAARLVAWLASPASDGISGRLLSAVWDPWAELDQHRDELAGSDIYTLRRIVPKDRGKTWGER